MSDRLQRIVGDVRRRLLERKAKLPEAELRSRCERCDAPRSFEKAIRREDTLSVIGELKRRSPSAGSIHEQLDVPSTARALEDAGCSALSILTEADHFGGSLDALASARAVVELPLLRKDFLFDSYQIYEARLHGADAVLLLAALLDDRQLRNLADLAASLGLAVLAEAHGEQELRRIVDLEFPIVGLNARDLRDFSVDLERILRWSESVPEERILVAESGVRTAEDLQRVASGRFDALLIGEGLMRGGQPAARMRELFGDRG